MNTNVTLLIVGIVVFIVGIIRYRRRLLLIRTGLKAEGLVVDLMSRRGGVFPVVQFKTMMGTEISKEYNVGTRPAAFKKGELVTVLYQEDAPEEFIIDAKKGLPGEILWIAIGVLLSGIGIYLLFMKH